MVQGIIGCSAETTTRRSDADAHRARLGVNYKQIPVNSPKVEVHSYSKDGAMRIENVSEGADLGTLLHLRRTPWGLVVAANGFTFFGPHKVLAAEGRRAAMVK